MAFTVTGYFAESGDLAFTPDMQGFGGYRWDNTTNGTAQTNTTGGRRGGYSFKLNSVSTYTKTFTAAQDWAINFVFTPAAIGSVNTIAAILDGTTIQVDLRIDATGHLYVTRNGTTLGTSTSTLGAATSYMIEMLVHIAGGTSGWVRLNVNGILWLDIAGANTDATSSASANKYYLPAFTGGTVPGFEDLFVRAGSGLSTSDALMDVGVQALRPTSDSTGANWTQSTGATHYGVVDDTPAAVATIESDYDSSSTVAAEQALGFADLASTSYTVVGPVQFTVWAKKDDVGTRMIKLYCVSNGTTSYSAAMPVLDSGGYFTAQFAQDPDGPKAWTATAVNAATFGYRLDS